MLFPEFPITKLDFFEPSDYDTQVITDQEDLEERTRLVDFGNRARLGFSYDGLSGDRVLELIRFYEYAHLQGEGFGIPRSLLMYEDRVFSSYLKVMGLYLYNFENKPQITTVYSNIYQVSITLVARKVELDAPSSFRVIHSNQLVLSASSSTTRVGWRKASGQEVTFSTLRGLSTTVRAKEGVFSSAIYPLIFQVYLLDAPEVYRDIYILTSPSSQAEQICNSRLTLSQDHLYTPLPLKFDFYPQTPTEIFPAVDNGLNWFSWDEPADSQSISHYEVQERDGYDWVTVKTINANGKRSHYVSGTKTFRIITYHLFGNNLKSYPTRPIRISGKCRNKVAVAQDFATTKIGIRNYLSSVEKLDFKQSFLSCSDTARVKSINSRNQLQGIIKYDFSNSTRSPNPEIALMKHISSRNALVSISKFDFEDSIIG